MAKRLRPRARAALTLAGALSAALMATLVAPPPPALVWNVSASAPIGLYRITPGRPIDVDDMVAARPPADVRRLAAVRRYLPLNVPLVKRAAAIEHDIVCAAGVEITINGRWVADRYVADGQGRALPWWSGCRVLGEGELFLLMEENPKAFDGRYFGITMPGDVLGRAILLWPR